MPPKKIALISDAWDPQVNGVVTTFKNIIPLLNKKGFDVEVLHPEMFSNFSYPWYKEIKFSYNTKNVTNDFFTKYDPDIIHLITEGPVGFAGKKISLQKNLKVKEKQALQNIGKEEPLPLNDPFVGDGSLGGGSGIKVVAESEEEKRNLSVFNFKLVGIIEGENESYASIIDESGEVITLAAFEEIAPGVSLIGISRKEIVFDNNGESMVVINFKNQVIERNN